MMKLVVVSCMLAVASSSLVPPLGGLGWAGGLGWTGSLGYGAPLGYGVPLGYGAGWAAPNYRGPLSLAPGQPANIIAVDGRPLDTLAVNLDRSAHYTAKALEGSSVHLLKKRSAPLIAPLALNPIAVAPAPLFAPALGYSPVLTTRVVASPYNYAPLAHW